MRHPHANAAKAPVRAFVVTCSDTRTRDSDESGQLAEALLRAAGHEVLGRVVVRDEPERIAEALASVPPAVQAIVVNGGTGLSRRDRTYDALDKLLEKRMDGFGELFRALSFAEIGPAAMLSRATAGLVGQRVVFSVPGSPGAVRLALERLILPELAHVVREAAR
jgi:molybdenum cofactor biosynthesis protein B